MWRVCQYLDGELEMQEEETILVFPDKDYSADAGSSIITVVGRAKHIRFCWSSCMCFCTFCFYGDQITQP